MFKESPIKVLSHCRVCRSAHPRFVTDFGELAVTNQFITNGDKPVFRQPISWHECSHCGVVQLTETPPLEQLRHEFPWLVYREPEGHLDTTAADLIRVADLQPHHRIVGLSQDDLPLLKRLQTGTVQLLDPVQDLGITCRHYGMETVQAQWTVDRARRLVRKYGSFDVMVARYALEHAHDAAEFLAACHEMLVPGGILVIEVPDCSQAFRDLDVTVVWDEHVLYFTEQTLLQGMSAAGFETLHFQRVPDPMEDRLVWIGRSTHSTKAEVPPTAITLTDPVVGRFAVEWPKQRKAIRAWAGNIRKDGRRLAVFGAGHRACTLIDIMGLSEFLDCVIDDSAEKQAYRFPVGGLTILGSAALLDREISCCLFAVNPGVEDRIVSRNSEYVASGGTFVSCYPSSSRVLRLR